MDIFFTETCGRDIKYEAENLFFGCTQTKYISLRVSKDGIIPLMPEEDSIKKVDVPTKVRYAKRFIVIFNYFLIIVKNTYETFHITYFGWDINFLNVIFFRH